MGKRSKNSGSGLYFIIALMFFILGVLMILMKKGIAGYDYLTQQYSGYGGHFLILVSIVFGMGSYYSLSPFGRVWEFLNKNKRKAQKS